MTLRDRMAADAVYTFLNNDEFAETIQYTPYGGSGKTIKAIVNRDQVTPSSQDQGRMLEGQCEIYIANDSTYGVTTVNKGQDTVSLPALEGGTNVTWTVSDIITKDSGMWHLLLER